MLVVGVDATARFDRVPPAGRGSLDPRQQLWGPGRPPPDGYPNLYDVRDGREVTVAYPLAVATGFRGARLVAFGLNTSLAYDRGYHVGGSRFGVRLKTSPPSRDSYGAAGRSTRSTRRSVSSSSTPFGGCPRSCDRC